MRGELHAAILVGAMSLVTILLRFLPFAVFSGRRPVPKIVLYLGDVLPSAAMGMLVVYCLKDVNFLAAPYGIPELLACGAVVVMQTWKRNTIWSILAGTAAYMLLIHVI